MPESGAIRASQNCLHPADQKIFRASREEKKKKNVFLHPGFIKKKQINK